MIHKNMQTVPIPDPLETASPGTRLRLLSYNIQVGIGAKRYRDYVTDSWKHVLPHAQIYNNLGHIARAISDFDIVALQEVDAGSLRTSSSIKPNTSPRTPGFLFGITKQTVTLAKSPHTVTAC